MQVSVIFATYKRPDILMKSLQGYVDMDAGDIQWELLVADNDPQGSGLPVLEQFKDKLPLQYEICEKPGKNSALNQLTPKAKGQIFLFTDDDVIPTKTWLQDLVTGMNRWPDHQVFGGKIIPHDPTMIPEEFKRLNTYQIIYAMADWDIPEGLCSPYQIFGCSMPVRREVFDQGWKYNDAVGPTGKSYIMGSETEFLLRLDKANYKMIYLPEFVALHQIRPEQTTAKWLFNRSFNGGKTTVFNEFAEISQCSEIFGLPRFLVRKYIQTLLSYYAACITNNSFQKIKLGEAVWNMRGQFHQYRKMKS